MKNETMTRREVINFLGIKLPVILLAIEILPGIARAQQSYTQMTFQATAATRDEVLDAMAAGGKKFIVEPAYDEKGNMVGGRVMEMDNFSAEKSHLEPGAVIYKINDEPFIFRTPKELENWQTSLFKMISDKQTITLDLDMNDTPYLYIFQFN